MEKLAEKLARTPEGVEVLLRIGTSIVSGVSEGAEEMAEAVLQPFLKKLSYDKNAKTVLDDPGLWWEYLYEGLVASVLGVAGSVNVDTTTGKKKLKIYTPLEVMDPGDLDFDPRALFGLDEQKCSSDAAVDDSDDFDPWAAFGLKNPSERENSIPETEETAKTEKKEPDITERKFLNGLLIANESDIIQSEQQSETTDTAKKPMTARERMAMVGEAILDKGGMPSPEQLEAMGESEATARGAQSLILLSKEGSPEEQRVVKAMIDATAPEMQAEAVDGVALSEAQKNSGKRQLNNGHSVYDMATLYAEKVNSNVQWSWNNDFPDAVDLEKPIGIALRHTLLRWG